MFLTNNTFHNISNTDNLFLKFLDNNSKKQLLKKKKINNKFSNFFNKRKLNNNRNSFRHNNKYKLLFRNHRKFFPYWYKYNNFFNEIFKVGLHPNEARILIKFPYKRLRNLYWYESAKFKRKGSKLYKKFKLANFNLLESRMNFFNTLFSSKARLFKFSRKTYSFLNFFLQKLLRKYFFLIFKSKKIFSLKNAFKFIVSFKIIYSSLITITNSFVTGLIKNKNLTMSLNKYFYINTTEPRFVTDNLSRFYTGFRERGVRFGQRFSSHLRINEAVFVRFFLNLFYFFYLYKFKFNSKFPIKSLNNNFSNVNTFLNSKSTYYFKVLKDKKINYLGPRILKFYNKQYKNINLLKLEKFNENKQIIYERLGYQGKFKNLLGSSLVFINDFIKDWWYEIENFFKLDKLNFPFRKIPFSYKSSITHKSALIKSMDLKFNKKFKKPKFKRKSNRLTFFFKKLVQPYKLTKKFKVFLISKIGALKSYMRFNRLKNYFKQKMTLRRFFRKYYQVPDSVKMYNRVNFVSSRPNKWRAFFKLFVGRLVFGVYWLGFAKNLITSKLLIMNGLIMVNGIVCTNFNYILENSDFIALKWDLYNLNFHKRKVFFKKCYTRLMQIQLLKHLFFNHDYDTIMKRRLDPNVNPFLLAGFKKKNYVHINNRHINNELINKTKLHQVLNSKVFFLQYKNLIYIELLPQSVFSFFNVFKNIENKYFNRKIFRKLAYRTYF